MSAFDFIYYYKNSDVRDIYRPYQMKVFNLRLTNKRLNDKEKNLVRVSSKRFIILLND